MSEWVERVAAAMAEKANGGKFSDPLFYAPEHKAFWMEVVLTGIEAIREPTKQMMMAGALVMPDYDPSVDHAEACWRAMLDEALKEKP